MQNIIQDIFSRKILNLTSEKYKVGENTPFGLVDKIEELNGIEIFLVKNNDARQDLGAFLNYLEKIVLDRKNNPNEKSYTSTLLARGINKVAQKVGEEAVEVVIEAKDDNKSLFLNESSDLLYHLLVLIVAKGYSLDEVIEVLKSRH